MSTLLTYEINLYPLPTAGRDVQLNLVVTNNSSAAIVLQGISIALPVGNAATDITDNVNGIVQLCPTGWKACPPPQAGAGTMTFLYLPATGNKITVNANDSFTLTLYNVVLNEAAGTATLIITEGSSKNPTELLDITTYPGNWDSIKFSALPANINAGYSVILNWSGPGGAIYNINYIDHLTQTVVNIPASGQSALSNDGQYPGANNPPLTLSESTMFSLQVQQVIDNETYQQEFQQTVSVIPAPPQITSFDAVFLDNNTLQFNWTTTGASRVEASWCSEELKLNNPMPSTSTTTPYVAGNDYTLTAYSSDNTRSCSKTIHIAEPPKITIFNGDYLGGNTVLFNWQTTGAIRVEASWTNDPLPLINQNPSTDDFSTGSVEAPFFEGKEYTLTAYSLDNRKCSESISVSIDF
jgi:hypothetical protein